MVCLGIEAFRVRKSHHILKREVQETFVNKQLAKGGKRVCLQYTWGIAPENNNVLQYNIIESRRIMKLYL